VGQDEVNWSNLPVNDLTIVPTVIPVVERGTEFAIVNQNTVRRPREVGRLTVMTYQVFTIEKTPFGEPVQIQAPNELTLAQLVTYFILATGIQLDAGSVFHWNLREVEDPTSSDKTKKMLEQIPYNIPFGFNLRVKVNTLHENSTKRMARCKYGSVPMCFAMPVDATVRRLRERVSDWMRQRGQPDNWTLGRADNEDIDFDYEYPVTVEAREQVLRIYLKQKEIEVKPSESWINLSDRLVRHYRLPSGTLFRIFPVIGTVDNQDSEDHSYDITWEDWKQYWYDIVYDISKDRKGHSKLIRMMDGFGRVDTLVVRNNATDLQILSQWKTLLEIPGSINLSLRTGNKSDYYWTYRSCPETIPCIFRSLNFHGNANIFDGLDQFKAEQISRILDVKMPPITQCHISRVNDGPVIIQSGEETVPLGLRILREHLSSWNLEGRMLTAPHLTTWWVPYDVNEIMRYGHSVNPEIPEDPSQAEFPPLPWPERVVIRIKAQAPPQNSAALVSVGGNPLSPAPDGPLGWHGVALGHAQPISADASGLVGYTSQNQGQDGTQIGDLPRDPDLLIYRGETKQSEEVGRMIS
jgi:hypothetical protein